MILINGKYPKEIKAPDSTGTLRDVQKVITDGYVVWEKDCAIVEIEFREGFTRDDCVLLYYKDSETPDENGNTVEFAEQNIYAFVNKETNTVQVNIYGYHLLQHTFSKIKKVKKITIKKLWSDAIGISYLFYSGESETNPFNNSGIEELVISGIKLNSLYDSFGEQGVPTFLILGSGDVKYIDLSFSKTYESIDMGLFTLNKSLEYINLEGFEAKKDLKSSSGIDENKLFYGCDSLRKIRCSQSWKEWFQANADALALPAAMRPGGSGVWDITPT